MKPFTMHNRFKYKYLLFILINLLSGLEPRHKAYGRVEIKLHVFRASTLDGGECLGSCCCHFHNREKSRVPIR
jgi:hypothetical protein